MPERAAHVQRRRHQQHLIDPPLTQQLGLETRIFASHTTLRLQQHRRIGNTENAQQNLNRLCLGQKLSTGSLSSLTTSSGERLPWNSRDARKTRSAASLKSGNGCPVSGGAIAPPRTTIAWISGYALTACAGNSPSIWRRKQAPDTGNDQSQSDSSASATNAPAQRLRQINTTQPSRLSHAT